MNASDESLRDASTVNTVGSIKPLVVGAGDPALLFVHGFGCTRDDWRFQIETLSTQFTCVALDLPGHGAATTLHEPSIAALAEAVNIAKRHSGARRTILVGHSLGAKVIREAYCQSSDDVVGMIFIEGALYQGDRQTLVQRARDAVDSVGFRAFSQRHFAGMFFERSDPDLRESVLARVRELDPEFARALFLDAVGWDPLRGRSTLAEIDVPALVIQTTYVDSEFRRRPLEPGVRTPFMEAVAQLLPQSQELVISGCGHFPLIEAADGVNHAIRDFALRVRKIGLESR